MIVFALLNARELMPMGSFLTYNEYKLLCYRHGQIPLGRDKTGPFVRDAGAAERRGEDLSEVFAFLCSQDGVITRECLGKHARKLGLDEEAVMGLFEILGKDQITIEDLYRTFGPHTKSRLPGRASRHSRENTYL